MAAQADKRAIFHNPDTSNPRDLSPGGGLLVVLLSVVAYAGLFIIFFRWRNFGITVAAMLPIAAAAWIYGVRGGIIAAAASLPANILLSQLLGADWLEHMFRKGMVFEGTLGFIIAGIVVGRFSDLGKKLNRELQLRLIAQRELKEHRDHLEDLVRSKTAELSAAPRAAGHQP